MIKIKTNSNDLIIVEIPEDAYGFEITRYCTSKFLYYKKPFITDIKEDMFLPSSIFIDILNKDENVKILGKLSELSEDECSRFVEFGRNNNGLGNCLYEGYFNYIPNIGIKYPFITARESLISLLQSNGIDINKEYLIIEVL